MKRMNDELTLFRQFSFPGFRVGYNQPVIIGNYFFRHRSLTVFWMKSGLCDIIFRFNKSDGISGPVYPLLIIRHFRQGNVYIVEFLACIFT